MANYTSAATCNGDQRSAGCASGTPSERPASGRKEDGESHVQNRLKRKAGRPWMLAVEFKLQAAVRNGTHRVSRKEAANVVLLA
jgi:hypothetical protein